MTTLQSLFAQIKTDLEGMTVTSGKAFALVVSPAPDPEIPLSNIPAAIVWSKGGKTHPSSKKLWSGVIGIALELPALRDTFGEADGRLMLEYTDALIDLFSKTTSIALLVDDIGTADVFDSEKGPVIRLRTDWQYEIVRGA